jgi:hypothetical protein
LGGSTDAVACANSDCPKNSAQADNAIEGDEESLDPVGWNKIVGDIHVAETAMWLGEMQMRPSGKDHHGCGEQLSC